VPVSAADLPPFDAEAVAFTYDAWHGYWHLQRNGTEPAYPFGFGLSYTTFDLERASIEAVAGRLRVSGSLRNTGERPGVDVIQIYGRRQGSSRPERLVGFVRMELEPGRSGSFDLEMAEGGLAERDPDTHTTVFRPGRYHLRVARHVGDPGITGSVELGALTSAALSV
jgi:beta-glucosidase